MHRRAVQSLPSFVAGWGLRFLGLAIIHSVLCGEAQAGPSPPVPEIDPGVITSGLTLLVGGLLVVSGRRVKK